MLAHEMSHVAHKDVAVMTIASFLGIIAALLVRFAFYSELFGGGGRRAATTAATTRTRCPIVLIVMVVGMVVYAISFLLIRLLSRYRELSADRSGALLTGQPSALASALVKVSGDMARIPTKDLRAAEPLNAFYFAPGAVRQQGPAEPVHAVLHAPVAGAAAGASWTRSPSSSASSLSAQAPGQPRRQGGSRWGSSTRCSAGPSRCRPTWTRCSRCRRRRSRCRRPRTSLPTGTGSVCFRAAEGQAFSDIEKDVT